MTTLIYFMGINGIQVCLVFGLINLLMVLNYIFNLTLIGLYIYNILFISQQFKVERKNFNALMQYIQPSYKHTILNSRFFMLQQEAELKREKQKEKGPERKNSGRESDKLISTCQVSIPRLRRRQDRGGQRPGEDPAG